MSVIIGLDAKIIPPSQVLPFPAVTHLPEKIEKVYCEYRKVFFKDCFYVMLMVARTLLTHIEVDLGECSGLQFVQYIKYLESKGYIATRNKPWMDMICALGNHYIHQVDYSTIGVAELAMPFISQLLININQLRVMAR
jgi:hypothetical protein